MASARFGDDLAWGSGGVALVVADGVPCGVGRRGELHALPPGAAVTTRLTETGGPRPFGIAHAAVVGEPTRLRFQSRRLPAPHGTAAHRQQPGPESSGP